MKTKRRTIMIITNYGRAVLGRDLNTKEVVYLTVTEAQTGYLFIGHTYLVEHEPNFNTLVKFEERNYESNYESD